MFIEAFHALTSCYLDLCGIITYVNAKWDIRNNRTKQSHILQHRKCVISPCSIWHVLKFLEHLVCYKSVLKSGEKKQTFVILNSQNKPTRSINDL